jgi:hypothetical protein
MWVGLTRWIVGTLVLLAFNCATLVARAQEPAHEPSNNAPSVSDSKEAVTKEWYGAPIVVTDIAALGLFFGGMTAADHGSNVGTGLMLAGVSVYLLGGPIVHISRHESGKGIASLGLRLVAPLAGAFAGAIVGGVIGSQRSCGTNETCGLGGLAVGGALGLVSGGLVAMVVDDAAFAYRLTTPKALALTVTPVYQPATRQTGLALRGTW